MKVIQYIGFIATISKVGAAKESLKINLGAEDQDCVERLPLRMNSEAQCTIWGSHSQQKRVTCNMNMEIKHKDIEKETTGR